MIANTNSYPTSICNQVILSNHVSLISVFHQIIFITIKISTVFNIRISLF